MAPGTPYEAFLCGCGAFLTFRPISGLCSTCEQRKRASEAETKVESLRVELSQAQKDRTDYELERNKERVYRQMERRETASRIRDIERRIGVACEREWIREQLRKLADRLELQLTTEPNPDTASK